MAQLPERFPLVQLCLTLGNTQSVARAVIEGAAEIGFVEDRVDDTLLSSTPLCNDQFVVVVAPGHPWADGRFLSPAALLDGK